jgi:transcriptional regulator with XRE-family HTH domain
MNSLRVKDILKKKGLNQRKLALSMGVAEISLSRSIRGNPSLETLEKIATALKVPVAELFEQPTRCTVRCPHCGAEVEVTINE